MRPLDGRSEDWRPLLGRDEGGRPALDPPRPDAVAPRDSPERSDEGREEGRPELGRPEDGRPEDERAEDPPREDEGRDELLRPLLGRPLERDDELLPAGIAAPNALGIPVSNYPGESDRYLIIVQEYTKKRHSEPALES